MLDIVQSVIVFIVKRLRGKGRRKAQKDAPAQKSAPPAGESNEEQVEVEQEEINVTRKRTHSNSRSHRSKKVAESE